jgi:hypothetical protein
VLSFAVKSFHASFPLLEKTDVNGAASHPVFRYLKQVYPGEITWNFHGLFVINQDGRQQGGGERTLSCCAALLTACSAVCCSGIPIRRFHKEPYPEIDAFIGKGQIAATAAC